MARILVVDDQKISRLTLAGLLGDAGHEVRAEATGPDGLAAARGWIPDVVILDVHMPEMDGFEVVERLKGDPVTEPIPVVFLTGDPPTDDLIVRGLDLGAYDFLSKGCSKAELLARVSVMERIKRSHDEISAIARISDALLRSVDPVALGRRFISEARKVFRADAVVIGVERQGSPVLMESEGLEVEEPEVRALLARAGERLEANGAAISAILDGPEVERVMDGFRGPSMNAAGVACVRRRPSSALVLILAEAEEAFREEIDGPLLRNLSSQAAIAIEHALLNDKARQQARDLERAMSERSRFFASLSHELRTPINAVIGYNHLLQERIFGKLSDRQNDALEKANRSAQHLLELVDDILDISKIEAGKLEIHPEDVDLAALLRDTATSLQLQARDKGIELELQTPESAPIQTDPARVRQIALNLLSNAVKFTEEGRVDLRLEAEDPDRVIVRVADTGPGVPVADQDRIFEEFEQARSGSGKSGTGLGLAISRRLARLLGGDLHVESEPGAGATFVLNLPREWPGDPGTPGEDEET